MNQTNQFDIILVANSPGELSAQVKPVAEALAKYLPQARVTLCLTPCQYISGWEMEYIKTLKGISNIISANDYKSWIIKNRKPKVDFYPNGLVLYLGGDLAHAVLIAKKAGYKAMAYIQDFINWRGFYKKFFIPDKKSFKKLAKNGKIAEKMEITGNLMVDSVQSFHKWKPHKNVITFLPGSRAWQIKHTTPIYQKIMSEIKRRLPDVHFQLVNSPFEKAIEIEGTKLIKFEEAYNSELVITIPGTNTARLAAMGIPMIVVFPLDNPDVIPLEGIPHFIGLTPFIGSKFKHFLINIVNKRTKFFALPNIKTDQQIVPEIRGVIDPAHVAEIAVELVKKKMIREKMSASLLKSLGKPGAAKKIVEVIDETLR